jgi:hypothetical protein
LHLDAAAGVPDTVHRQDPMGMSGRPELSAPFSRGGAECREGLTSH